MKVYTRKCLNKECKQRFEPKYEKQLVCDISCSIAYSKQKQAKDWKAQKKVIKEKIKTKSDYVKELQKEINTIVRLIDKNSCCISTQKPLNDKFDAGHFYSCGSNPALRFNLFNVYAQSVYANQYLSGDINNFLEGLSNVYDSEHKEYVLSLKTAYKELKISQAEIQEKIPIARQIVRELKKIDLTYPPKVRLQLRKQYNERLGIYNQI
jgi:hypothetical protein